MFDYYSGCFLVNCWDRHWINVLGEYYERNQHFRGIL